MNTSILPERDSKPLVLMHFLPPHNLFLLDHNHLDYCRDQKPTLAPKQNSHLVLIQTFRRKQSFSYVFEVNSFFKNGICDIPFVNHSNRHGFLKLNFFIFKRF